MAEKADIPVNLLSAGRSTALIEAWFEIVHLKQLYRRGWLQRGVSTEHCESVAEHTFGNAMLALLFLDRHPELDAYRVLRLALVHDLGEAYVGDITPADKIDSEVKKAQEAEAIEKILRKVPGGDKLIEDWQEYEAQETPEALFVKQIDRLEFAMQASVYEHQGRIDASEFFGAIEANLSSDALKEEFNTLRQLLDAPEM
jgi:putative hydrolase of HD superfamily